MRLFLRGRLLILICTTLGLFSCSDKTEEFITESPAEYLPLQVGKYITYRIDSLVFVDFQKTPEVHKYQVKHIIDAELTDNNGHPIFRVYRYLRDENGTTNWEANGSYVITQYGDRIEVVEDNLRFIKLHAPMREGYTWKGNKYLPIDPYDQFGFNFSNDDNIAKWDFNYYVFEPTLTVAGNDYSDVFTVEQQDDFSNVPVVDTESYGYKSRSVEKYSKGIGLVYREYELWEYQPNLSGSDPYYTGFGITMWMIDHN